MLSCLGIFQIPIAVQNSPTSFYLENASIQVECQQDVQDQLTTPASSLLPSMEFVWGWNGNLSFEYRNETIDQGIENATVQYWWAYESGFAYEIGNGTYAIPIDTRRAFPNGIYPLTILASKAGHEPLNQVVLIRVLEVPTEIVVYVPPPNQQEWPWDLYLPLGDSLNITLFYNDTDSSEGYVGGIPDAESICQVWGPTLPMSDYPVTEIGNGYYRILIDSMDPSLYITTGGKPVFTDYPYYLNVVLHSQNRSSSEISLRIRIIEIPTEVEFYSFIPDILFEEEIFTLEFTYSDTWHDWPISGASVSVNCSDSSVLQTVTNLNETETNPGVYNIQFVGVRSGTAIVTIWIEKEFHIIWVGTLIFQVEPGYQPPPPPPPPPGLPISLVIIIAIIVYYRKNSAASSETSTSAQ